MKGWVAVVLTAAAVCVSSPSDARGRFLAGLLSSSAKIGAGAASSTRKSYTADTLTVAQLAQCIKSAAKLDDDAAQIETFRTGLHMSRTAVEQSEAALTQQRSKLNRSSKSAVKSFNEAVERHNALLVSARTTQENFNTVVNLHNDEVNTHNGACAKRYYADDLPEAHKLAGITGG